MVGGQWRKCEDHEGPGYTAGAVKIVGDLNGDARPEAIITEESSYCYGMAGTTFDLVSKQIDGSWKLMASGIGIPKFLTTKGVGGWPDIEIGGPGFCFPVERWNGKEYQNHRQQYEGKSCED
ncbi:hypothetical protein GCM10011617_29980 [Novosphingobium arvoryzae]|uniref:FG-GAP repeat protein n=1 Tax=Novosphingobium arvoryzae TaxID=1256514 RepID=A0A918RNY7_9SPHN|nr:hypothetical protein GCM10011617_29980 [Novosphingobium arvoryzae]